MSPPFPTERWISWILGGGALLLGLAWLQAWRLRRRNEELARLSQRRAKELEAALAEAEAASRAKGDFLAVMSHELRTPIHALLGMTELLLASSLDREQRESARTVQRAGKALLGLFNDVLDFSRIEAGRMNLRSVPFDVGELVEDLLDLQSLGAQEKGLELVLRWEVPEGLTLCGDPDRIRQVLLNLLGNAVKFTSEGHVLLAVEGEPLPGDRFHLRFVVVDTGPGIPVEKQDDLFEAFTQADTSITRRYGGAGLGLAISRRLVEAMGGEIGLESSLGKGSTFWAHLKLPKAPVSPEIPKNGGLKGLPVLVFVQQPAIRESLVRSLARLGAAPSPALSKEEAGLLLAGAESEGEPFQVVLMEEGLVAAPLREAEGLRWVLLCPLHKHRDLEALRRAGFSGVLRRPVLAWELREFLEARIRRPLDPWLGPEELADSTPAPEFSSSLRVLLAEDNPLHRQVATRMLRGLGVEVDVVPNGREAVAQAREGGYDLLMLDGQMPELDGLGAARALREMGLTTPILAMTAHALPGDLERFMEAGADGFLAKPFGLAELMAALESLLPRWEGGTPPPSSASVDGLLDRTGLLKEEAASPGATRELIALYCLHAPARMRTLRRALAERDLPACREAAHALAGSAACIRADSLADLGRRLEFLAVEGRAQEAAALWTNLDETYRAVWRELEGLAAELEG